MQRLTILFLLLQIALFAEEPLRINGHLLPPEPDPTVNNSTLLGIDSNNNGVRDDVERWIFETYKDKHPVHIDIAMQAGRAYAQVLKTPDWAKEIHDFVNTPIDCEAYYMVYAKYFNRPILVQERIDDKVFRKVFNTKNRENEYWKYDKLLSGDTYGTGDVGDGITKCDFNTSKHEN